MKKFALVVIVNESNYGHNHPLTATTISYDAEDEAETAREALLAESGQSRFPIEILRAYKQS